MGSRIRIHFSSRVAAAAALSGFLSALHADAGGFEKSTMWSGRYSGIGGAASAVVSGPESVFLNPAGLARGKGTEISINASPTFSQFSGPVAVEGQEETSTLGFSPLYGAAASFKLSDRLGIGFGSAIVGGAGNQFNDLDFSQLNFTGAGNLDELRPDIGAKLIINEVGLGVGYQVSDNWSLGLSWRATLVSGHLQAASVTQPDFSDPGSPSPGALANVLIDGLSAVDLGGFRAGIQYINDAKDFGFGINYRSALQFTAEGETSGEVELASSSFAGSGDITGGSATVTNSFPQAVSAGFMLGFGKWRVFPEYTFTNYSVNRTLILGGTITLPQNFGGTEKELTDVTQNWRDQHNGRLGLEYDWSDSTVIRAAYVATTAVVPGANARATFSAPGLAHSLYLGGGHAFSDSFRLDATGEYSTGTGDGTSENGIDGTFTNTGVSMHLGASFRF